MLKAANAIVNASLVNLKKLGIFIIFGTKWTQS